MYWSTVDKTARNCPRSPVLSIILELQRTRLMSTHGVLPTHIRRLSSTQFLHFEGDVTHGL